MDVSATGLGGNLALLWNIRANYDREIKPTFLAFTFAQKMALEGKMLSPNHMPKQGPDGFVMYFIGDKYKERFEALPDIVKEDYEKFLEEIKNKEIL